MSGGYPPGCTQRMLKPCPICGDPDCRDPHEQDEEPMTKELMTVDTINALAYDLAHDIDLTEKAWIIPSLKGHIHQIAKGRFTGYTYERCDRLISQWVAVRQGKLNPVPRSLP